MIFSFMVLVFVLHWCAFQMLILGGFYLSVIGITTFCLVNYFMGIEVMCGGWVAISDAIWKCLLCVVLWKLNDFYRLQLS